MIELRTREVEQVIALRFGIAESGRTALRGRLEHLRRLGTPAGVQMGQGRAATFGWEELLQLAVAVELLNVGLTPDHAHRIVNSGDREFVQAFAHFAFDMGKAMLPAVESRRFSASVSSPLYVTADAFSSLRDDGAEHPSHAVRLSSKLDRFQLPAEHSTSRVTLDVALVAINLMHAISRALDLPKAAIVQSYHEWAGDNVNNS